jgi:putative aldouronate transport system permease protein
MIYTIVGVWNSWFNASIYITNRDLQPVQLYLKNILASTTSMTTQMLAGMPADVQAKYAQMALSGNQIKFAMIVITVVPIIFVYPMFQKHFTKGIMLGSLKG